MDSIYEICVTLRVSAHNLDPERVTRAIGFQPTKAYRRGDRVSEHGRAANIFRKHGYWGYSEESNNILHLSEIMRRILSRIPPDLNIHLREPDLDIDFFIGVFGVENQSSIELDADVLRETGTRGWPICFDLYVSEKHSPAE